MPNSHIFVPLPANTSTPASQDFRTTTTQYFCCNLLTIQHHYWPALLHHLHWLIEYLQPNITGFHDYHLPVSSPTSKDFRTTTCQSTPTSQDFRTTTWQSLPHHQRISGQSPASLYPNRKGFQHHHLPVSAPTSQDLRTITCQSLPQHHRI